jgi:hypothetical protein
LGVRTLRNRGEESGVNGEEFYDLFKDCLAGLGIRWAEKAKVEIYLSEGVVTLKLENMIAGIVIPVKKHES